MSEPLIPKHGGYRNLKSFQVAQLAYDVTVRFCDRDIDVDWVDSVDTIPGPCVHHVHLS